MAESVSLREYVDAILKERSAQVETALASINQRLALLNELRGNVATRDQLEDLRARIERSEGKSGGMQQSWLILVGAVTIAGVIGAILARHF